MNDQQKEMMATLDKRILKELNKTEWDWNITTSKVVQFLLNEPTGEVREFLIGRAIYSRIQELANKKRKEADSTYEVYKPTDADKAGLVSVAEGTRRARGVALKAYWDFPLPGGGQVKNAIRDEILAAVANYDRVITRAMTAQKNGQVKKMWLTFVAELLDSPTKTVSEQCTPEEVLDARDRAENLA